VSEVVRAGLRLLEEQENRLARLRSEIEKGEQSPIVEDFSIDALIEELDQEKESKAE
jgi:antitoxin ParD1/3/4